MGIGGIVNGFHCRQTLSRQRESLPNVLTGLVALFVHPTQTSSKVNTICTYN
jgi:hypothetical protein